MFIPFLLVYAAFLVAAACGVAWLARRLPRAAVVALVTVMLVLGVAFAPVPTHGGFLLPGPELVREALHDLRAPAPGPPPAAPDRFAGFLPAGAPAAFRDPGTGLVWSESLDRIVLAPPWRRPAPAGIDVRCVAVTQPATLRGYLPSDVPLRAWNAYQLGQ